jgi:segregation and condensation protein A
MTVDLAPLPLADGYQVSLPQFEGPLDLLLHLIQKHEIDIFDIPISFVTERYLDYVELMQRLDLDIAAEYLVMAATLAHIKSRMLLPASPADDTDVPVDPESLEDPREALVRRLLEYQKFRSAAEELAARGVAGRDIFPRGADIDIDDPGMSTLAEIPLFALLDAFEKLLKRRKLRISHEVTHERVSIAERIQEIVTSLRIIRTALFEDLFDGDQTQIDLVVTFLALLEMTRLRMTRLYQTDPLEPLHVTLVLTDVDLPTDAARDDYK